MGLNKQKVEETWDTYWKINEFTKDSFRLNRFRTILLKELVNEINFNTLTILNAGCGLDPLPIYLLKKYKNINIILLDISQTCLDINKSFYVLELSELENSRLKLIKGNIFDLKFEDNYFDIVYNTGVIEHFNEKEQISILKEFNRVLKHKGKFITLNPCIKGKLYIKMKYYLEKHDKWEFGTEYPIDSLKRISKSTFKSFEINEKNMDFQSSTIFLIKHNNKFMSILGKVLFQLTYIDIIDKILLNLFGGYILLSIIKKK